MALAQTPAVTPVVTTTVSSGPTSNYKDGLLDINRATRDQLIALGLSGAAADKVIAGRPYGKRSHLMTDHILSRDDYSKIYPKIFAFWPMRAMVTR